MAKRVKYDSINNFESSGESEDSNQIQDSSDPEIDVQEYRSRRKPKCFSKNAEMARQNRLKKKIHLAKLEKKVECLKKEKNNLTTIVHQQNLMLNDLNKEVRYLKGVLANSSDIRTLIRNIHDTTGMPVSSSLSNSLKVCTAVTSKSDSFLINKDALLSDPCYTSFNSFGDYLSSNGLFDDSDIFTYVETSNAEKIVEEIQQITHSSEHNYTRSSLDNEDYGICLHVCKNKVSLEFCSSCEENARKSST